MEYMSKLEEMKRTRLSSVNLGTFNVGIRLIVLVIAVLLASAIIFSILPSYGVDGPTSWTLEVRGDVTSSGEGVEFTGMVTFVGHSNGDIANGVSLHVYDDRERQLGQTCIGTLVNDGDSGTQVVSMTLPREPSRLSLRVNSLDTSTQQYNIVGLEKLSEDTWATYDEPSEEYLMNGTC